MSAANGIHNHAAAMVVAASIFSARYACPTAAHARLVQAALSSTLEGYSLLDEDPSAGLPCEDPFCDPSPLFALLSPHLQLNLLADVARWLLVPDVPRPSPGTLSLGHCAALWALECRFKWKLEEELQQAESHASHRDGTAPARQPVVPCTLAELAMRSRVSDRLAEGKRISLQHTAARIAAEGGSLEDLGLHVLPPAAAPPPAAAAGEARGAGSGALMDSLRLVLPAAGRGALPSAPPGRHNRCRRALLEAWAAQCGGAEGGALRLPVSADSHGQASEEAFATMLSYCMRALSGPTSAHETLVASSLDASDQARLRSLLQEARRLNSAYAAAYAADPLVVARAYTQLQLLSLEGGLLPGVPSPFVEAEGDAQFKRQSEALDDRERYSLDAAMVVDWDVCKEARAQRHEYVGLAQLMAKDCKGKPEERPVWQCRPTGGCGSAGWREGWDEEGADAAAHAAYAAAFGLPWPVKGFAEAVKGLLRARAFGQYHLAMEAAAGEGIEGEGEEADALLEACLERAYASPAARYRAICSITHPFAPLRLLLQSPAEALAAAEAWNARECTTCDQCERQCSMAELKACSACSVQRYCSVECQKVRHCPRPEPRIH